MNNVSLYLPIMDKSIRLIQCSFRMSEDKVYTYKCPFDVKVGDIVIVEARDWFAVARVTKINVPIPMHDEEHTYRWVVQVIHMLEHEERLKHEQSVIDAVNDKRANAMRDRLLECLGLSQDEAKQIIDADAVVVDEEGSKHA